MAYPHEAVLQRDVTEAAPRAGAAVVVGGIGHALTAASHHHRHVTQCDGLSGQRYRCDVGVRK
jgi:hypothetical protein